VHIKFIFNELNKQHGTRANPEAVNGLADLSRRRPGFSPRPAHMGFVTDKLGLGQVFLRVFRLSTTAPRSFICLRRYIILLVDSIVKQHEISKCCYTSVTFHVKQSADVESPLLPRPYLIRMTDRHVFTHTHTHTYICIHTCINTYPTHVHTFIHTHILVHTGSQKRLSLWFRGPPVTHSLVTVRDWYWLSEIRTRKCCTGWQRSLVCGWMKGTLTFILANPAPRTCVSVF